MLKRIFDLSASILGLTLLSPVFMAIAVLIRLDSRGPIFYRARRVGQYGWPLYVLKFRSMVTDADRIGPGITTRDDRRITRIGRFLRRSKLDELPQLLNVVRGDMSLVGPRPEDPRFVAFYTPEQRAVLCVKPGITSLAAIKYRDEAQLLRGENWETVYIEHVMPEKLALDLEHITKQSLWFDVFIILRTLTG